VDIVAISKYRTRLLGVELKRGKVNSAVVGQIQRHAGSVKDALLEPGQSVEGVIIVQKHDPRIRRAVSVTRRVRFMRAVRAVFQRDAVLEVDAVATAGAALQEERRQMPRDTAGFRTSFGSPTQSQPPECPLRGTYSAFGLDCQGGPRGLL